MIIKSTSVQYVRFGMEKTLSLGFRSATVSPAREVTKRKGPATSEKGAKMQSVGPNSKMN
jgi:hypothetical protein